MRAPTPPPDASRPGGSGEPASGDDRPVLPDVTADEGELGWGDPPEPDHDDDRYLREVPPHHGS